MKKKFLSLAVTSLGVLYGYSHLAEKRSFSSFSIEKLFRANLILNKNSSSEDKIYDSLKKSVQQSKYPLELPRKYVASDVYEFFFDDMQVFCWNDRKDMNQKIILYIHGGGYVAAPLTFHYRMVENIAQQTNAKVIFPIYERVPIANYKDVFPKMVDLYKKILDEINSPDQITIMGDSAGGGMALGLALLFKEIDISQPKNIILLSPWLDISNRNHKIKSIQKFDPMLDVTQLNYYGHIWSDGNTKNQLVSPILGNPENLGKISIFVGTHEIFYPDIIEYHDVLEGLNIDHNLIVEPRMNHVYVAYPIPEAKKARKIIARIINDD